MLLYYYTVVTRQLTRRTRPAQKIYSSDLVLSQHQVGSSSLEDLTSYQLMRQKTYVQLTKEKTQESDLEYRVFMKHHSRLTNIPSLVNWISYFVDDNIITSSDGEVIKNTIVTETQTAALMKLLSKISMNLLLGHGSSKTFDKFLKIMRTYGDNDAQSLATEMLKAIEKLQSTISFTPTNTGTYVRM